jgi:hypothetical protein
MGTVSGVEREKSLRGPSLLRAKKKEKKKKIRKREEFFLVCSPQVDPTAKEMKNKTRTTSARIEGEEGRGSFF